MQYNGEENSSGRKSDSSTISQILRLVSKRLKKIWFLTLCIFWCHVSHLSPQGITTWNLIFPGLHKHELVWTGPCRVKTSGSLSYTFTCCLSTSSKHIHKHIQTHIPHRFSERIHCCLSKVRCQTCPGDHHTRTWWGTGKVPQLCCQGVLVNKSDGGGAQGGDLMSSWSSGWWSPGTGPWSLVRSGPFLGSHLLVHPGDSGKGSPWEEVEMGV